MRPLTAEERLYMADNAFDILVEALRFANDAVSHCEGISITECARIYSPQHPSTAILVEFLERGEVK